MPKLRFPGFEGEWEEKRIGDIYSERSERPSEEMELLSVTITDGVIPRTDIEWKDNSSEDKSNYKIVRIGDMAYNTMRMWQGACGISSYEGIVSPAYTILKDAALFNHDFMASLFKTEWLINNFRKNSQGLTSDTWNLKYPQIATIKIRLPSISEQNKIANLLTLISSRIVAQRKLVELLKKHKRGLLDRIFERSKQTEKWKKYRLDQIAKINPSSESLPCEFFYIDLESVSDGVWHNKKVVKKESAPSRAQRIIQKNDILFQMVRPYQQNNLHITSSYDKPIVASTGYAQIRTSQNPSFIYWLLHSRTFLRKVLLRCTGSSYPAINSSDLKEIYVSIPSLEDQDQYARALNSISQKCSIEESLVCHLENLKSGLLQQMFV